MQIEAVFPSHNIRRGAGEWPFIVILRTLKGGVTGVEILLEARVGCGHTYVKGPYPQALFRLRADTPLGLTCPMTLSTIADEADLSLVK